MIPTSYTYETFRDYLEKEVLQNVAKTMEWIDVYDELAVNFFSNIIGTKPANSYTVTVNPVLKDAIPKGTVIDAFFADANF